MGAQSRDHHRRGLSPLIEFSDKLNNRVDSKRIEAMPLSGRDFNSLLNVTPGVQHKPGGGFQGVNASGARTSSNNFMIDGISNNDRYYGDTVMNSPGVVGVPATLVPMDAIGDFTVQQTPSAEFGVKGGAAINVVMKSGGNMPHGTGYYFRHDDWTDSPNFFVKRRPSGGQDATDADEEPAVRRHLRRADPEGQDVLLRLLRRTAAGGHLAVRRARPDDGADLTGASPHRGGRACRPTRSVRTS